MGVGTDLQSQKLAGRLELDLKNSVLAFLRTGNNNIPSSLNLQPFGGQKPFPSGFTFQDFGLPQGFNLTPGSNPLLDQAFGNAATFGQGGQGGQGILSADQNSALSRALSGQPSLQLDPAIREQFFQDAITRPILQNFTRNELPGINAAFLPGGQTGAALRAGQEGITNALTNIGAQQTGFLRDEEALRAQLADTGQARSLQALQSSLPFSLQQQLAGIQQSTQLGGIQRSIAGAQNQEQFQRAQLAQPFNDPRLGLFGAFSGNPILAESGNSGLAGLGGVLSGLGGLAGALGGFF